MPEVRSGPKTTDYHQDHQRDSRTYRSLRDRGQRENPCTT